MYLCTLINNNKYMEKETKALYVVTHDYTSLTKIGVSKTLGKRLNALKSAVGAELKIYYESPTLDNWREIELDVIKKFKTEETAGEWVNATPEEIIEYIKTIEYKFNNPTYTYQENDIEAEYEKISQCGNPFYSTNAVGERTEKRVYKVIKGVYRDDNYIFYVTYHLGNEIVSVAFNVYKSAKMFAKDLGCRLIELDLEAKKYIQNPKFRINYE